VKCVKTYLLWSRNDHYLVLLDTRNTPRQDVNRSHAKIVFGRNVHFILPVLFKLCAEFDAYKPWKWPELGIITINAQKG